MDTSNMSYDHRLTSERNHISIIENYCHSSSAISNSHNSFVLIPSHSDNNSNLMNSGISHPTSFSQQPISDSYEHFLTKSIKNCPKNLYEGQKPQNHQLSFSTSLGLTNSIEGISSKEPPMFFLLTDSHGKYFPPVLQATSYRIIVKPISGLQWINHYDKNLCTRSLLLSSSISSILSSCVGVLFLIGTNSIRNTSAPRIIEQLEDIIDLVRFNYDHLQSKADISITSVFPCHKTSKLFPSISSLSSNVNNYNILLEDLSIRKDFSMLHLPITVEHLNNDGLHIRFPYVSILWNFLEQYLADLIIKKSTFTRCIPRSRTAVKKRNKKQHEKLKQKRKTYSSIKYIDTIWKLKDLKAYLKYKEIKYGHLLEIRRNKLYVYFNNIIQKQQAERILNLISFDANSFSDWCHTSTS
ncbi:unnamed protein product [Rotaria magnacalcarata]|uniref:Uncharacterized protein n=4 Tax=Rotaria TaxID=231623 RepID=A0A816TBW9_9BILA|nr:unnamed protein product [Rotaria magnacalcarata]CAF4354042.1 unnamed protein product [Rotaria magnacalcarata]